MQKVDLRIAALRRFATAISLLTIAGHSFLGFEQSYAYVAVALLSSYSVELLLETILAYSQARQPRYLGGGIVHFMNFLLPAHITPLAIAMLLYSNERLWPIVFATVVATSSKYIFTVQTERGQRHFFNPSNTGIAVTLILFSWVGIAPPYQFSENISGAADIIFPLVLLSVGSFLNYRYTKKLPLIIAWVAGFILQALLRSWWFGTPALAALNPITGIAFLLFTFYMVSDPGTTPFNQRNQIIFGLSVAFVYMLLMLFHIVFGLFFALFIVCSIRGAILYYENWQKQQLI